MATSIDKEWIGITDKEWSMIVNYQPRIKNKQLTQVDYASMIIEVVEELLKEKNYGKQATEQG